MDKLSYKQMKKQTEHLWASRKYDTMARGYQYYKEIAAQFRYAIEISDMERIILRLEQIAGLPYTYPGMSTAIQHMWGYVKPHVTNEERQQYEQLWITFRLSGNTSDLLEASMPLLSYLACSADQYRIPYLQLTFQASFLFLPSS